MAKDKKAIYCPECFGHPEIEFADAPGHLKQHWDKEPDESLYPLSNRRYHILRDQILEQGGEL